MQQRFGGGETGDDVARRKRRDALRRLEAHMEEALRPVRDLIQQLKGVQPPDYGTLDVRTTVKCLGSSSSSCVGSVQGFCILCSGQSLSNGCSLGVLGKVGASIRVYVSVCVGWGGLQCCEQLRGSRWSRGTRVIYGSILERPYSKHNPTWLHTSLISTSLMYACYFMQCLCNIPC